MHNIKVNTKIPLQLNTRKLIYFTSIESIQSAKGANGNSFTIMEVLSCFTSTCLLSEINCRIILTPMTAKFASTEFKNLESSRMFQNFYLRSAKNMITSKTFDH